MMTILVMVLVCFLPVVRADGPVDESSVAVLVKAMLKEEREQMRREMAQMKDEMAQMKDEMTKKDEAMKKKDEAIAALTAALESKQIDQKHIQLTTSGEVLELVSTADVKALEKRVEACEKKNEAQDVKIGMTVATVVKMREERKDGRVGAPPSLPPAPPPPLPPRRPVANPGRQLSSSSNGNFVNELSITGPNAVVSWNSHTPGLTSINCTGVGDGKLLCSGEVKASDFVDADGSSFSAVKANVSVIAAELAMLKSFIGMLPPSTPSPPPPAVFEVQDEFLLDGTQCYFRQAGNAAALPQQNNPYTIEVQIRPAADTGTNAGIVFRGLGSTNQANALRLDGLTGLQNYWFYNDLTVSTSANLSDGRFHAIVAAYDGSTRYIWLNGTLLGSLEGTRPVGMHNTVTNFCVGAHGNAATSGSSGADQYFKGNMRGLRIYDWFRPPAA